MQPRKILVTTALTYANGSIHLGHLVEAVQADIWVRFQRMRGHECYFISGSDAHGTAIMLKAQELNITPESLVESVQAEHKQDYTHFLVDFDNFYTTHSAENYRLSCEIYVALKKRGDIVVREISQAFDPLQGIFLPDRFIKGTCPRCQAPDQYGDNCEVCGATYSPSELIEPRSAVSGATPVQKTSTHYFFQLQHYETMLREWGQQGHLQANVVNKLKEWFETGLRDWDISRDAPYFGFEMPDAPGKYFYVWLDAPIGYLAIFENFCQQRSHLSFEAFFAADSSAELYHFVGKDITYFHALFWPAMLEGAGYRKPTSVFVHGFLTVNGQKMSKSRGTFIKGSTYLKHADPEHLRYYFASKLTPDIEDIDLNVNDFISRVNADLVGKVVNIASRCAGFISQHFDSITAADLSEPSLYQCFVDAGDLIAECYENRDFARAMREIMLLADRANQYIADKKPWSLMKLYRSRMLLQLGASEGGEGVYTESMTDAEQACNNAAESLLSGMDGDKKEVQAICSMGLELFRLLILYLKPVLPLLAEKGEAFLMIPPLMWGDRSTPLLQHQIAAFTPMMQRIMPENMAAMMSDQGDV